MTDFKESHDKAFACLEQEYPQFMRLTIYVNESCPELKKIYVDAIQKRYLQIISNPKEIDAGFDLFCPHALEILPEGQQISINFNIRCKAAVLQNGDGSAHMSGYYLYPRSSLSKTPLRLANSVGIIDSGYRGEIIGKFDISTHMLFLKAKWGCGPFERLVQLCAPSLMPILPVLVDTVEELGSSQRGEGGFGSTGRSTK